MSTASTLCAVHVVLSLMVLCLPVTHSQAILSCEDPDIDIMPVQPSVYGISTLTETLCPLANNGQDIVICIPRGELTLSLTESVSGVIVCLVNRSQCNNLLLGEELYDAVLVQLWNVEISGRIEIAASINIYFGVMDVVPLNIDSGQNLSVPGDVVILERLYTDMFSSPRVCKILPDNTIVQSMVTVVSTENTDCLTAMGGVNSDLPFTRSLVLTGQMTSIEQTTVTLFLVSNSESCSATAERLSNNFTINLIFNETTTEPPSVTTSDTALTEGLSVEAIVGISVAVPILVVVVLSLVCVCCVRYIRKKGTAPESSEMSRSGPLSNAPLRDSRPPPVILQTDGFDTDSGYPSPSPSPTPGGNITFVSNLDNSQPLKTGLESAFGVRIKKFQLPSDSDEDIEQLIKDMHPSSQVKYVLFVHDVKTEEGSESFRKLNQYFQTRPCPEFWKVWYLRLGASENVSIDNNIHIRNVAEIGSWSKCAQNIYRQISSYTLEHGHPDDDGLDGTTSYTPHSFPTHKPLPRSPSTDPVLRKLETIGTLVVDLGQKWDSVQKTSNNTFEAALKIDTTLHEIHETSTLTKENTEDIMEMQGNQAMRMNPIVGETHSDPPDS